ncbi:MAG: hypothetical protein F6J98_15210 [Moorea sp. SIO4G2]|uniref:hypothetical protein n=1 Tax=unclassified Moorena TaxID=2683338 RepID=UPI0013FAE6B9|nr:MULTISPECIES: hypothetical protein [unclassified Moorena]NEO16158.1 hypothetical protein [Moorena sp. SIO3E8]NEO61706.1 hypothetical protein [Moorena sp. SIO4G2]NEQ02687.1 hypothetical protein [Moorena sp. SIO3F7]
MQRGLGGFPHERLHQDTGILPVTVSHLWNGHQAWKRCSAVLGVSPMSDCIKTQASCLLQFPGGQDAQSTPIHSKTDATPELWLMAEPSEYNCVVII